MVNRQLQDILKHVEHPEDDDEVREYLRRILRKQAGDGSGLIYNMLGISEDIYTPLFAIARVPGWCAHRVEEVIFANRIIRPAYKYLGVRQKYKPIEER